MKEKQKRTVRFTIDLPMEFPADWDDKQINFHINESSWCLSNIIDLLDDYDEKHGCICRICKGSVIVGKSKNAKQVDDSKSVGCGEPQGT